MIVDPDFLDHWKTQMLIDLLDDCSAPLCVIRLWGHCQTRRAWVFDIPPAGVKSICRFSGDAEKLDKALTECGFLMRNGAQVEIVGWDEHNASLIANWKNGKKGGRPTKDKPKSNPSKTHGLPTENPTKTHGEPIREDRIGLDKKGEEKALITAPAELDAVIYVPTNKYGTKQEVFTVTQTMINDWSALYPNADVMGELRKAVGWSDSNPAKRKTIRGMKSFLNSWLSRAHDRGGVNGKQVNLGDKSW